MKLFKNPVFAVVLCLLLILGSTCLNAKVKMENKYDRLGGRLYDEIVEFADENGLAELKTTAHAAASAGDYRALISAYDQYSLGNFRGSDDVDDDIRAITKFLRSTQRFPASVFVDLFDLSF
ncbi:MAG: hypothetical protein IJQ43_01325 [Oscillospiraceae bacterium]|nr:hypothetical protein [Oscillospiraceae bacterium]